jgi:hypothetical protein
MAIFVFYSEGVSEWVVGSMHWTVSNYYTFQSCTDLLTVPTEMFRNSYRLNNYMYNGQSLGKCSRDSYELNNYNRQNLRKCSRDSYELNNYNGQNLRKCSRDSYEFNNYNGQNLQKCSGIVANWTIRKCSGIATNLTSCLL